MVSKVQQYGEESRAGSLPLVGGALALDFANTASGRGEASGLEHLRTPEHVVTWAEHAGIVDAGTGARIRRRLAMGDPPFSTLLDDAIALRETIHHIAAAIAARDTPRQQDLVALKQWCARSIAAADLRPGTTAIDSFVWTWPLNPPVPESLLGPIALSAAGLLRDGDLSRLKQCAGEHCGWVFLDLTKNKSRRWCEMSVCGNRAKARRFRKDKAKR